MSQKKSEAEGQKRNDVLIDEYQQTIEKILQLYLQKEGDNSQDAEFAFVSLTNTETKVAVSQRVFRLLKRADQRDPGPIKGLEFLDEQSVVRVPLRYELGLSRLILLIARACASRKSVDHPLKKIDIKETEARLVKLMSEFTKECKGITWNVGFDGSNSQHRYVVSISRKHIQLERSLPSEKDMKSIGLIAGHLKSLGFHLKIETDLATGKKAGLKVSAVSSGISFSPTASGYRDMREKIMDIKKYLIKLDEMVAKIS